MRASRCQTTIGGMTGYISGLFCVWKPKENAASAEKPFPQRNFIFCPKATLMNGLTSSRSPAVPLQSPLMRTSWGRSTDSPAQTCFVRTVWQNWPDREGSNVGLYEKRLPDYPRQWNPLAPIDVKQLYFTRPPSCFWTGFLCSHVKLLSFTFFRLILHVFL